MGFTGFTLPPPTHIYFSTKDLITINKQSVVPSCGLTLAPGISALY